MALPEPLDISSAFPCRLNIVLQVVGSRDEVEIFITLGYALKNDGHRIRISSHDEFRSIAEQHGLEFFPIGGDPAEFKTYMVSPARLNSYLAPTTAGPVARKRLVYEETLERLWESCIAPDPTTDRPFVADAIIANPTSFAHVHCAERLKIPCHLISTTPCTSTAAFGHPLADVKYRSTPGKTTNNENGGQRMNMNLLSYMAVNLVTWQELGDVINRWRVNRLELQSIPSTEGPQFSEALKIPITYCWPAALLPKPTDWGVEIDICGLIYSDTPSYTPPRGLEQFLNAGPPPIYIELGGLAADRSEKLLAAIVPAIRDAGARAIISHGANNTQLVAGEDIFNLMECSYEWIFNYVSVVVHSGEAGITACGLRHGCPIITIPVTADHSFWGTNMARAGVGPEPLPHKTLTSDSLKEAILFCLSPRIRSAAAVLGHKIAAESGVSAAVASFYKHLPINRVTCHLTPSAPAVCEYRSGGKKMRMSRGAVAVLWNQGKINMADLKINNSGNVVIDHRRWEPVSAITAASLATVIDVADAAVDLFRMPMLEYRKTHGDSVPTTPIDDAHPLMSPCHSIDAKSPITVTERDLIEGVAEDPRNENNIRPILISTASGLGKVVTRSTRGVLVDIPLAATEGMRAVPQLWGESVEAHKPVEDWRSGFKVAARSFTDGISGAVTGLFIRTIEGKKRGGTMGAVKGLGQGALGFATKSTGAIAGLVTYPAQGFSRSISGRGHGSALQEIMEAIWSEAQWMHDSGQLRDETAVIIKGFESFKRPTAQEG